MQHVLTGFGVFLGVVAGTLVTLLVQWVKGWVNQKKRRRDFKFELEFNVAKLDKWIEFITEWRNAVNSETMVSFWRYFDLSRVLSSAANELLVSGVLYRLLDHEDIAKLQKIFGDLSPNGEQYMNNQVSQDKSNFDKSQATMHVDYWERLFKDHRDTLAALQKKL